MCFDFVVILAVIWWMEYWFLIDCFCLRVLECFTLVLVVAYCFVVLCGVDLLRCLLLGCFEFVLSFCGCCFLDLV